MSESIKYEIYEHPVYKYRLLEDYAIDLDGLNDFKVKMKYVAVSNGVLKMKKGYAWDGPSGIAVDTVDFQRASLVHDAMYQMIRERQLPGKMRKVADHTLYQIAVEDGMPEWRARYAYVAVRLVGWIYARPKKASLYE